MKRTFHLNVKRYTIRSSVLARCVTERQLQAKSARATRGSRLKRALMNSIHTPVEEPCGRQQATCTRRVATRHDSDFSSLARARGLAKNARHFHGAVRARAAVAARARGTRYTLGFPVATTRRDSHAPGSGCWRGRWALGPPNVGLFARAINAIQDDRLIKIMPRTHAPLFRSRGRSAVLRLAVVLRF